MYYNFSFDQYICYEIEEGIVKVTSYNEPGVICWRCFEAKKNSAK